jgi:plastocyanin
MKRTRSTVLRAALIGGLLTFGVAADPAANPPPPESAPADRIVMSNFAFEPSTLTVSAGTVVTWLNEDDAPHTVIGTDPESPIKSQPLDTGDHYSIAFTKPGTYRYFCSLHPHMTGTVIVDSRF